MNEMEEFWLPDLPREARRKSKWKPRRSQFALAEDLYARDGAFRCMHCGFEVPTHSPVSGVGNRNHCPVCLWSRHLDLLKGGDRLSVCKAAMRPVGLTFKRVHKKYGPAAAGELMLIHACTECGRLSINRVAADDHSRAVLEIFARSQQPDPGLLSRLSREGIDLLRAKDESLVHRQLFGTLEML